MKAIPFDALLCEGAVSVAVLDDGLMPYRLPWRRRALFAPELADGAARHASGVRLRCDTDAETVTLDFAPMPASWGASHSFDLTIDNALVASVPAPEGATSVSFTDLPREMKELEIWLPQGAPVTLRTLRIDEGALFMPAPDPRPRWVTYGSSITHCVRAHSPARTWPALVARRRNLHLTCLGYGGQCHLEPLVGMMIRELPADLVTLKLGINTIGGSLSPRTLPSAAIGLVRIIRERKPEVPIALISPIAYPPHETEPNVVGYTMRKMRDDLRGAYQRLVDAGDDNLYYFDGLEIFGEALLAQYSDDQCHPGPDGIEVMAEQFDRVVMDRLPLPMVPICI